MPICRKMRYFYRQVLCAIDYILSNGQSARTLNSVNNIREIDDAFCKRSVISTSKESSAVVRIVVLSVHFVYIQPEYIVSCHTTAEYCKVNFKMNLERRKQGLGRLSDEQRNRKNAGQSYKKKNGNAVGEKRRPNLEVSYYF